MNINVASQNNIDLVNDTCLNDQKKLFYIDSSNNSTTYKVIKINYVKYHQLSYEEVMVHINNFHNVFTNKYKQTTPIPKILILIDVDILKKSIEVNTSSIYNINLINVIKHINTSFNDNIYKCVTINCNEFDKTLIILFKTFFKHIDFVHKIVFDKSFLQNS